MAKQEDGDITNTTREMRARVGGHPLGFFLAAQALGAAGAIEHQEKQGQGELVNSHNLPTQVDSESKAALTAAGVVFGPPVEGDEMFCAAILPAGWKKESTDHSMWSKLVDDKGRTRAMIFYKAAFYDRSAHMSAERRFNVRTDYDRREKSGEAVAFVEDCGKRIHETAPIALPKMDPSDRKGVSEYYALTDRASALATEWLAKHFPRWEDAAAYWD